MPASKYKDKEGKPKRRVSKFKFDEISLVDRPSHRPAMVTLAKRSQEQSQPQENEMAEANEAVTELTKQVASANAEAENAKAELAKRDEKLKELEAKIEKMERPKPEVIFKMEGVGEVTTESDAVTQALAKRLQEAEFAKQAAEKAPDVAKELAVSLLKAGQEKSLETLQKQQKELKKSGRVLKGEGVDQDDDDGGFVQPDEAQIAEVMKTQGFAKRMDAVRHIARQRQVH